MALLDTNWILGLGVMFGLAIFFAYLTYKDFESFMIFLTIFSGFVVWSGLLDLWILVLNLIVLVLIIGNNINNKRRE